MALSGTLGDFSLTDILQLIGLQRKTGVLVLRRADEEVSISFDGGRVIGADHNLRPIELRVGELLVRTGRLSEQRLQDALRRQSATLQRLGRLLLDSRWIDKETLARQLALQITETIYDLFRWKDGEYDFRPQQRIEWDRDLITPIPSENLLMEGARMVDEWPLIERVIPSRAVVLRPTARGAALVAGSESKEAQGSVYDQDIDFGFIPSDPLADQESSRKRVSERERVVLRWVDGRRTAGEVAELTGLGTFESFHVMAALVDEGLLESAGRRGPRGGDEVQVPSWLGSAAPARALSVAVALLAALGAAAGLQELVRAVVPGPRILPAATPIASSDVLARLCGLERLRRAASGARLARLDEAIQVHYFDQGRWPRSLSDLVDLGLVDAELTKDPWGEPYIYEMRSWGYRLGEAGDRPGAPLVREHHDPRPAERAALD